MILAAYSREKDGGEKLVGHYDPATGQGDPELVDEFAGLAEFEILERHSNGSYFWVQPAPDFEFYDPRQPRDKDGKFSSGGGSSGGGGGAPSWLEKGEASGLHQRVIKEGGFTYDPIMNDSPTSGYVVSIYPEAEFSRPIDQIDETVIGEYITKNKAMLEEPNAMLGGWYDEENGLVYLDVSVVTSDKQRAINLAKEYSQEAIFDLSSFETIVTKSESERRTAATGELMAWLTSLVRLGEITAGQALELYSPSQPRDKDGKFSSGGGSTAFKDAAENYRTNYSPGGMWDRRHDRYGRPGTARPPHERDPSFDPEVPQEAPVGGYFVGDDPDGEGFKTPGGAIGDNPAQAIDAEVEGGQMYLPGEAGESVQRKIQVAAGQRQAEHDEWVRQEALASAKIEREIAIANEIETARSTGQATVRSLGLDPDDEDWDDTVMQFEEVTGMSPETFVEFSNEAWVMEHGDTGLYSRIESLEIDTYDGATVSGKIYNHFGDPVGNFDRVVYGGSVTHDFFKIDSDEQGSGFGSEFFFHSEEAYTNYGISEIKVHANITVGGYAWARMGFDFDSDDVRQDFADTISTDWMRQSRLDFANKTKKDIFSPDFNESHERWIEHLGENESIFPPYLDDAPAWEHAATVYESPFDGNVIKIGKTAMLNSDWYGTKDLWGDGVEAGDLYYATKKNR